jgi:hypothetical protein
MPDGLKTDQSLLDALSRLASRPLSAEEIEQQRVSFIMGTVKSGGVTRERVKEVIAEQMGKKVA